MPALAPDDQFAREVRAGLSTAGQKSLPCRYFYDEVGSALFDAITALPEYGLTRADARILRSHSDELVARLAGEMVVVELGSGSGAKTRFVLDQLSRRQNVTYYPIDVSASALARCVQELAPYGDVTPLETSYLDGLAQVAGRRRHGQRLLVLFLGSTIGNFEPDSAIEFLRAVCQALAPGDAVLLGTDLVKPVEAMLRAYDDPAGVTAAFNRNLLARINRELEGDFDVRQFDHLVVYGQEQRRIEMHLRSRRRQQVTITKARLVVDFEQGETIFTEACHKFLPSQICDMARLAGFRLDTAWVDEAWPFAESLLIAA